jgi:hypothetical protein
MYQKVLNSYLNKKKLLNTNGFVLNKYLAVVAPPGTSRHPSLHKQFNEVLCGAQRGCP